MLGNILTRLKSSATSLITSTLSADSATVMEAMMAAATLVAYADNTCQNEEVDAINHIIQTNPQLREFHNEPARIFDQYCGQMEASPLMAKSDLFKKITEISGDTENSPRVLITAIEIAYASKEESDTSAISKSEELVLTRIADILNLRLGTFI